jgi:PAS domain S-box-containing protein
VDQWRDSSQQIDLLRSVFDSIQDGISVLDPDLNVRLVNAAMEQWYPKGAVLHGRKCYSVFQWRNEPCPQCPALRALETGTVESQILPGRRDSPAAWLEIHAYPLKDPDTGQITGIVETIRDITKNRKLEDRLRWSEEHHRRLFETISQGVIYQAADGTIISANPAAERILGLSLGQMTGKTSMDPCWKMIREDGSAVDGPDHPAMDALRTGKPVGPVVRGVFHPRRNEHVWLSITAIPLFMPGETTPFQAYATIEDITARRDAEARLVENERKYRQLFETSPVSLWVEDFSRVHARIQDLLSRGVSEIRSYLRDHPRVPRDLAELVRIVDVNQATLALYGAESREEFFGQLGTVFTDRSYENFVEALVCIAQGKREFFMDDTHVSLSRGALEVRIHWAVVPGHEERYDRVVVSVIDLTEYKQAEDQVNDLLQIQNTLLKETHHRIKNNFATMEALLSLQAEQSDNPEVSVALDDAQSRITSMRVLYEKLLQTEQYQKVHLRSYLEDLAGSVVEAHAHSGTVSLDTRVADVELDAKRTFPLGAITAELLTNSLKYAFDPDGAGTITVALEQTGDQGVLRVSDNGRGMTESTDPEASGSFGLMLVRMMADQLGGIFQLESRSGEGTTGTISFPLSP